MAVGAAASFSSILGGSAVVTLLSASSFHRTFFLPTSLARTLASSHSPFKHIHKHQSFNVVKRNLSCRTTSPADCTTNFSIPTCNNRYSALLCSPNLFEYAEKFTDYTTRVCFLYIIFPKTLYVVVY